MLAISLVFSVMFSFFALILGGLIGWTLKQNSAEKVPYTYHPEMFDEEGNVIPDQLIAFSFDNFDYPEEEEDQEE